MADNPSPEDRVAIDELTPEEASRIIHSHRKVRYGTPFFFASIAPDARRYLASER